MSDGDRAHNEKQKIADVKRRYRDGEISLGKMEYLLEQILGKDVDTAVSHDEIVAYEERTGEIHPVFHVDHRQPEN